MGTVQLQQISIIGTGSVATNLTHALSSNGALINEVYSREIANALRLSNSIQCGVAVDSLDFSSSHSRIFIIAVKDDAINEVVQQIKLPEASYLFHTSGTVPMQLLSSVSKSYGIFYPLQTFAHGKALDLQKVPILVEGNDSETQKLLTLLGYKISNTVHEINEADRKYIHLAAVFASNFTNRMLAAAGDILKDKNIDIGILKPLVEKSVQNIFSSNPDQALTGPAKRGDLTTIKKHQEILKENKPEWSDFYREITESIISKFSSQH